MDPLNLFFGAPFLTLVLLTTGAATWLVAAVCGLVLTARGIATAWRWLRPHTRTYTAPAPRHIADLHLPDDADPPAVGLHIPRQHEGDNQ